MTHPLMYVAAKRHTTVREQALRSWAPRSVTAASQYARRVLGDDAATLTWEALGVLRLEEHLQAFSSLDTASGQHLVLHYSGDGEGDERLVLRRTCDSCTSQQADVVTSLEQLGLLLTRTAAWADINARNNGDQA
ncbi:DUF6195 family protein [Streptomyces sp. NPDC059002]|uniref:DUF6195 family protein n=1 Tax=Streptomyces sp. NPDC059002 TaxID=3346690 RepID=UPI0036C6ABE8